MGLLSRPNEARHRGGAHPDSGTKCRAQSDGRKMAQESISARSAVALRLPTHGGGRPACAALGAPEAFKDGSERGFPAGKPGERLGPRLTLMTAVAALQKNHVLPTVVGELHDVERGARGHHVVIVASIGCRRPYSARPGGATVRVFPCSTGLPRQSG
jgi:hypothetical protein